MVKYYTQEEIAIHNHVDDCWVTIFDDVYDITDLIKANRGALAMPLLSAAGGSISHWFNEKTHDLKTYIDPVRNIEMPYTPQGRFLHVPSPFPEDRQEAVAKPWWRESRYIIGKVSKRTLKVRITNMLTRCDHVIKVCKEESLEDIKNRYFDYNFNSNSYTWKTLIHGEYVVLKNNLTLEQNGIADESENFLKLGMDEDFYLPNLLIFYNDDLHEA
eukprot:gene4820-5284_t